MRHPLALAATMTVLLLAASCGGGGIEDATPTPTCTTVTPGPDGSPTPTPTPCLIGATEAPPTPEPTGELVNEVWEGEWVEGSGFKYASFCPQFVPISGTISFVVADDGSVSGRFEWANDPYTCGGPAPSVLSKGKVTGERTADGFLLGIFGEGYPLRLIRQGNEASGRVEAGGNTTHALTVRCVNCG